MRRYFGRFVFVLFVSICVIGLLISPVLSQQKQKDAQGNAQQKSQDDEQIPRLGVTEVFVPVTVVDKRGRFVYELKQEDFEVYEDKKLQEIKRFEARLEKPIHLAVLMDTSASVRPKLKFEKEAAISFIQTVLKTRKDKVLFATFDSAVELRQDFTDSVEALSKAIEQVRAGGDTRLYDAVYRVCEEKMGLDKDKRYAMIIISDGADTASERTLQEAIDIALQKEVLIYGISTKAGGFFGVGGGQVQNEEDKELRRLCEDTGGEVFFPGQVMELERAFRDVRQIMANQYGIWYEPKSKLDGKFHRIEVKLVGSGYKEKLEVRAKKGYIAVPSGRAATE